MVRGVRARGEGKCAPRDLASEVVEEDILFFNSEIGEHLDDRFVHHGRATDVVLAVFRRRVIFQVIVVENLMNEPGEPHPFVFFLGFGKGQVPLEVFVLVLDRVEIFDVKSFTETAGAVPEAHFPVAGESAELVEDMRTHGSHTGPSADKDHFVFRFLGKELAIGTRNHDLIDS